MCLGQQDDFVWRSCVIFIFNFKHNQLIHLVFILLTLSMTLTASHSNRFQGELCQRTHYK